MNGLFSGMFGGGANAPTNIKPQQGLLGGGIFGQAGMQNIPAMQNFMSSHPNVQNVFSKLGQGASSPMTAFGAGMMGGGGWGGGIQPAMTAMKQQQQEQMQAFLQKIMAGGGLGGGGAGPAPASIY
jgi:hypothetical protein